LGLGWRLGPSVWADMATAAALPRANCFFEDEQNSFKPYDRACRHFAEAAAEDSSASPLVPPPTPNSSFPPDQVVLNVYELTAFEQINRLMATELFPIGGALHVGVEVYGREWCYGGGEDPDAGVRCEVPRSNSTHRFRETLALGTTPLSDGEVALVIGALVETWHAKDYHWLHRNCLAFANELCQRLKVGRIPAWIDRFARGAGVVDLGVRGLAGGLLESVQSVALGAQELVRAMVEGPGACTSCVPTSGSAVYTVSYDGQPPGQPWERICMVQGCRAWSVRRGVVRVSGVPGEDGLEGSEREPPACVAPQWRSIFEVLNNPDQRIAYAAGGAEGVQRAAREAALSPAVDPRSEAPPRLGPWLHGGAGSERDKASGAPGSPDSRGQVTRLEKWFQFDNGSCSTDGIAAADALEPPLSKGGCDRTSHS